MRLVLLSPAVEERLVVVEDEILVALAEIGAGAVYRKRLREPVLLVPQPDRVEVRVADEVDAFANH